MVSNNLKRKKNKIGKAFFFKQLANATLLKPIRHTRVRSSPGLGLRPQREALKNSLKSYCENQKHNSLGKIPQVHHTAFLHPANHAARPRAAVTSNIYHQAPAVLSTVPPLSQSGPAQPTLMHKGFFLHFHLPRPCWD